MVYIQKILYLLSDRHCEIVYSMSLNGTKLQRMIHYNEYFSLGIISYLLGAGLVGGGGGGVGIILSDCVQ